MRNVIYRIHDQNSLNIRRERYKHISRKIITGAATAATFALFATPNMSISEAASAAKKPTRQVAQAEAGEATGVGSPLDPPHS